MAPVAPRKKPRANLLTSLIDITCDGEMSQGDEDSNATLVALALDGGPKSFGPIVERYKDAVFGVALSRIRNFHDAEDLTHSTFVEAFSGLPRLRDPDRLGAWLRTITIHRCINFLKRRQLTVDIDGINELESPDESPQEEMERTELQHQVLSAIGRLSKTQRETVTLFYISEYSIAEVAAILEVPVGTVKRRLHDARERLREEMLEMVEEVLKNGAPDEALADRVFDALVAYPPGKAFDHTSTKQVVAQFGGVGKEGFVRSFNVPHWRSRQRAVRYVSPYFSHQYGEDGPPQDFATDLLIKGLQDKNRNVRRVAADRLLYLQRPIPLRMSHEDWIELVLPHFLTLLSHPSRHTRRMAVGKLRIWASLLGVPDDLVRKALPLAVVCRPMAQERDPEVVLRFQWFLESLLTLQES